MKLHLFSVDQLFQSMLQKFNSRVPARRVAEFLLPLVQQQIAIVDLVHKTEIRLGTVGRKDADKSAMSHNFKFKVT